MATELATQIKRSSARGGAAAPRRSRAAAAIDGAWKLAFVLLVAGATYGSLEVERRLGADPRFQLSNWRFQLGGFPEWVRPEWRAEIEAAVHGNGLVGPGAAPGTIFQPGFLRDLRRRLGEIPWIRSVHSLDLRYPGIGATGEPLAGELLVDLELRRPVAAVQYQGRCYLVDMDHKRLGPACERWSFEELRLPLIVGAERFAGPPPPEPGQRWAIAAVREGIDVAWSLDRAEVNAVSPRHTIQTIDIQNVDGEAAAAFLGILLRGPGLPPMAWGRAPSSEYARVVPEDELLQKLKDVLRRRDEVLGSSPISLLRLDVPGPVIRVNQS